MTAGETVELRGVPARGVVRLSSGGECAGTIDKYMVASVSKRGTEKKAGKKQEKGAHDKQEKQRKHDKSHKSKKRKRSDNAL